MLRGHITFATRLIEVAIDNIAIITLFNDALIRTDGRSQWPRGLRRRSAEIVGSNPTGGMYVCLL